MATAHPIGRGWLTAAGLFLATADGVAGRQEPVPRRVEVVGSVRDAVSGAPVPHAVVRITGLDATTLTNADGRFRLLVGSGQWELTVRKIGYEMATVRLDARSGAGSTDVALAPFPFQLEAITVTAEADDLARRIIREAIARKNDVLARVRDYRYEAYTKFVVRDMAKPEDDLTGVVLITETQTRAFWGQPDRYQETITARRQSSNLPAENNLVSVGEIVNFNRNRIDLAKYSVPSPTADDALEHYDYHVADTVRVGKRLVYRLAVEPTSQARPLFAGWVDIADSTFDIMAVDVGVNEAVRFDFLDRLRYRQTLAAFGDGFWMPVDIRFSGEVHLGVPLPGLPKDLVFTHQASLRDFRFDTGDPPETLGEFLIVVDDRADDVDSLAWSRQQSVPLTAVERAAYARIDSIQSIPDAMPVRLLNGALATLFLSGQPDFFHFNRVEGAYVGLGGTVRQVSPSWTFRVKTGHAFSRDDWQHRYGLRHRLSENRRLWIGAEYRDDIVARPTLVSGGRNFSHYALLTRLDPLNYYGERGLALSASTKLVDFTQLSVAYRRFDQYSVGVATGYTLFDTDRALRPNPSIADGRLGSVAGSLTYDSRPLLKRKGRDYYLNLIIRTRLTAAWEFAQPNLTGGDFEFFRWSLRLHRVQRTLNLGLTTLDVTVGGSTGILPPQRFFTVDFGNEFFFREASFNTLNETNFSGSRVGMVYLVHDFDQQLFRRSRLPLIDRIPFTVSAHGGVFWTDFDGPPHPADAAVSIASRPYSEIGFGLANLTPWLSPFNLATWWTWQTSAFETSGFVFHLGIR